MLPKCFSGKNTTVVGGRHTHRPTSPSTLKTTPTSKHIYTRTHLQSASRTDARYNRAHASKRLKDEELEQRCRNSTQSLSLSIYLSCLSLSTYVYSTLPVFMLALCLSLSLSYAHVLCVLACLVCVLTSERLRIL